MAPLEKTQKSNLARKILAVMASIGTLKKDKKNDFHNYQYASDELIVGAIRAALIEHGLSITTSQKSCTEIMQKTAKGEDQILTKLEMEFELTDADSGESKVVTFFGYGSDKADKGVYKAMTGAEKYFLMKTFLIATPDDPEFDKTQRAARSAFSGQGQNSTKPVARPPASQTASAVATKPAVASPAPSAQAPSPSTDFPPPSSNVERKIIRAFLKDVTMIDKTSTGGTKFYKLNGIEGESWTVFSETVAKAAKEFAAKGTELTIALDMNPRGAVAVGIRPA